MKINSKDPGKGHFYISLIKSAIRIVSAGLLSWAGYVLWSANMYSDIFIADSGLLMMLAGIGLLIAEVLGIAEEIV